MQHPDCPVGKNIHASLDSKLKQVQSAMENELASIRLSDVADITKARISAGADLG